MKLVESAASPPQLPTDAKNLIKVVAVQTYASAQEYGMGSRSYDAEFADIVSYSADDQSVGQYYIALAAQYPDDAAAALEPVKGLLDHIRENPSDVDLDHSIASVPSP